MSKKEGEEEKNVVPTTSLLTLSSPLAKLSFAQYFDNRYFSLNQGIMCKIIDNILPEISNTNNMKYEYQYKSLSNWDTIMNLVKNYEYIDVIMKNHPVFAMDNSFRHKLSNIPINEYFEINEYLEYKENDKTENMNEKLVQTIKIFPFAISLEVKEGSSYIFMNDEESITRFQYCKVESPKQESIKFDGDDSNYQKFLKKKISMIPNRSQHLSFWKFTVYMELHYYMIYFEYIFVLSFLKIPKMNYYQNLHLENSNGHLQMKVVKLTRN